MVEPKNLSNCHLQTGFYRPEYWVNLRSGPRSSETTSSRAEGSMRSDIVPGAKFPDYELTDHARQRRSLSEITLRRYEGVTLTGVG